MLRIVSAYIALIVGFAAPSVHAQSYPDGYEGGDYGGGGPTLILPEGYGAPDSSHDSYGNSEPAPADVITPDGVPTEEGEVEDGH